MIAWGDITTVVLPAVILAVGSVVWIQKQINDVRRDLADYKESVAKEYVTAVTLEKVEERIVNAIDRLGTRLDNFMADRLRSNS